MMKKHQLIDIDWPEFGGGERPAPPTLAEFDERLAKTRDAMSRRGLSHLVVYGDREHFANLTYLTNLDPRFEEALLIIGDKSQPLLVVGNECDGYVGVSPLYVAGRLRKERFQPFSLLSMPREGSRQIRDIFAGEGIGAASKVGCAGWKYFTDAEVADSEHAIELSAFLVDALRGLAGRERVVNATDVFMHPGHGLRSTCSPAEIAFFEYTNVRASEGMRRMLFGLRDGIVDIDLSLLASFTGEPLGCHMTLASTHSPGGGLAGPTGLTIRRGDTLSTNICYWGSNVCRAGWVAETAADLPAAARDYVERFAGVYFEVLAEWFSMLRIGVPGGDLARLVAEKLPYDVFGIFLNPGHLIHLDEWLSSPIYEGSKLPLRSGMVMQVDVIPSSPTYFSTRMEDGVVLADAELRRRLQMEYPGCFERCQARREFMAQVLGINLPHEVLPLSNMTGIVPPFLLRPRTVLALR